VLVDRDRHVAAGGYRVAEVRLPLGPHRLVPGLLAVPEGSGPFPACLLLHDHGARFSIGKEKLLRPPVPSARTADAQEWVNRCYGGRFFGDFLARQGWMVLCCDALGWGDRAVAGYEAQQALASNLLGLGTSWAGLIAAEDRAAVRWLARRPEVDPDRVAAAGFSMGSVRTWQLHALCDEVRAAAAYGGFGTTRGQLVPENHRVQGQSAFSMTHPGLARCLDQPDVAALAAPKPLWMRHGLDDPLFPVEDVARAYDRTAAVYRAFGRPGAFDPGFRPGGHRFGPEDQDEAAAWLARTVLS